jgi:hypothetical protein
MRGAAPENATNRRSDAQGGTLELRRLASILATRK